MKTVLSGVNRSSGSSDWLKDMFLQGDFDAMVNYECLVIQANQELEAQGREPLYAVYPTDGLTIADSPLAYVDQGDGEKEELFLKLQEYLLSDEIQSAIQRTGRRSSYTGVNEENRDVFREDWGLQPDRVLSPMKMPAQEVLFQALDLYQTEFKKPSLNVYCLDYSGSMSGEGNEQLVKDEIACLKEACKEKILKVIIETCLLTEEEKITMCRLVTEAGADYIKTSTGFSTAGATFQDVALFARHIGPHVKIKAAGGISSFEDAEEFLKLGADRLGTSRLVKIEKAAQKA